VPLEDQLRIINEVAEKYIAVATPSDEDLAVRKELKDDLEKVCQKISPNGTLELFGSVACKLIYRNDKTTHTNSEKLALSPSTQILTSYFVRMVSRERIRSRFRRSSMRL